MPAVVDSVVFIGATAGVAGSDLEDGIAGIEGIDGTDGSDLEEGIAGAAGTDGTDGTDGTLGMDGIEVCAVTIPVKAVNKMSERNMRPKYGLNNVVIKILRMRNEIVFGV